jgi:glycerophosphoryl diester phosphodiesterase
LNPFLAAKPRPIVVGHRGLPRVHQENSLAGFRRAIALGVPAVEMDCRLTRDGRAVVVHDYNLGRLTGTDANVCDLTWDELAKLRVRRELPMGVDAGGAPVTARYEREEPIALLEEVLAELGGKAVANVELKLDLERWWPVDVGEVVAREIERAGAIDRVIVTSFDPRKLRAAARAVPGLAIGFCFDDSMLNFAAPVLDRLRARSGRIAVDDHPGHNRRHVLCGVLESDVVGRILRSRVVGAEHTLVGAGTVRALHARGVAIGTHTLFPIGSTTGKPIARSASSEAEVARLVGLGVDWMESDDPERLMRLVC